MTELPSQMGSFTLKEAAFLTHVSRSKLTHFCHARVLLGHRVSKGYWRVSRKALLAFMHEFDIPLDLSLHGTCPQREFYPPKDFKKECNDA